MPEKESHTPRPDQQSQQQPGKDTTPAWLKEVAPARGTRKKPSNGSFTIPQGIYAPYRWSRAGREVND